MTRRAARSEKQMAAELKIQHFVDQHLLPSPAAERGTAHEAVMSRLSSPITHPSLVQHPVARRPIPLNLRLAQIPNATRTSTVVINLQRHPSLQVRHLSEVQRTRLALSELCNIYIRCTFRCCVASYSREATPVAECGGRHRCNRIPNGNSQT
jgi:hypothetical protein